jgi:hypothetical protein
MRQSVREAKALENVVKTGDGRDIPHFPHPPPPRML